MMCSLRSVFILPVLLAISASFCLAQTGPVTRIQEDDPSIVYSGNWYKNVSSSNSGSSAALTNATGARAVVTFTGRGISWIGVADRWNGLATVTLDGLPRKIDGWGATTRYQAVMFTVSGLSIGAHKLSIEISHERGPNGEGSWVWLDAFDVQDGAGVPGGLPAATVGRIEDDNPAVTYTGIWYPNLHPMHSGGTAVLAVGAGAAVSLNFNGTEIAWIAYRDEWSGLARVIVDGELKATIDTYLLPGQARTAPYRIDGLTPGNHSMTIEVTGTHNQRSGGAWVWLDAFDVISSTTAPPQTPVLSIGATAFCVGNAWTLGVSNARATAPVRLIGTSNGQSWAVADWATIKADGTQSQGGAFAEGTQGSHTLRVEIDGKTSNTVSFAISSCRP
jgi:hypothetical protein